MPRINYRVVPLDKGGAGLPGQTHEWLPFLPVKLSHGKKATPWFPAFVDSGSHCCLFDVGLARTLEIDLTKGVADKIHGLRDEAWIKVRYVKVSMTVAGETLILPVGFAAIDPLQGLLGRAGFFENFTVLFDHEHDPPGMEIDRIVRG